MTNERGAIRLFALSIASDVKLGDQTPPLSYRSWAFGDGRRPTRFNPQRLAGIL